MNDKPKTTQVSTKGILNVICERYGVNRKNQSVSIQQLIRYHKPKQQAELTALIASHQEGHQHENCACGSKSKGTVETFATNLYNAYKRYVSEIDNTVEYKNYEDCLIFIKHLFVINSIKGNMMEDVVVDWTNGKLRQLNKELGLNCKAELANELMDFSYAVDVIVKDEIGEMFGIQVKPVSYKNFHEEHIVVKQNKDKNKLYGKPVVYVYYNEEGFIVDVQDSMKYISLALNIVKTSRIPKINL